VGTVTDLREWKRRRGAGAEPYAPAPEPPAPDPLDELIARLDRLIGSPSARLGRHVETELLAIIGAVHAGLLDEALARGGRLAARLEHPSARIAR
jgi:hypothetical protein